MRYYNHLYTGPGIESTESYIEKLEKGLPLLNVYLIMLSEGTVNQLDIFDAAYLHQNYFFEKDNFVVGIAKGHTQALLLVEEITKEVYDNTEGADIKQYILEKQKKGI